MTTSAASTHKRKSHYAVDQVSRILHTQNSMKSFLGAMSKPAPPTNVLSSQLCPAADAHRGGGKHARAPGGASASSPAEETGSRPAAPRHTLRHTSFKLQVKQHPHIYLVCSMCSQTHSSMGARYLFMPMLAKPWIPVCGACYQDHVGEGTAAAGV